MDKPVGKTVASFSSPHSPSFQACAPQPTFKVVASFQLAWSQVNRPHPEVTDMIGLLC
jgi:hypothetical protein